MGAISDFWFGPGRGASEDAISQGQKYAYIGQSPYDQMQSSLLQQLQMQSNGQGPNFADMQYRQAAGDQMSQALSMGRGRGAGAMRQAGRNAAMTGQGLAAGSAMARTNEMMSARGLFQNALTSANQADFQRAQANQAMYQQALGNVMQQGGIGQSLAGLAAQGIGAYAMMRGPGGGGGIGSPGVGWGNGQNSLYGMQRPGG